MMDHKTWREVVQEQMYAATLHEAVTRYGTDAPLFNYRWEHVQAVVRLATRLAVQVGADVEVVEAAAWLHDIAKQEAGENHPAVGAQVARQLLQQTDFPSDKITQVAQAIEQHMGLWRDTPLDDLEAAVLWDADKLSKIGLTAAFHGLGARFAKGKSCTSEAMITSGRGVDWQAKTVASMHTAPAKRAAQARFTRYAALWDEFEQELGGQDL